MVLGEAPGAEEERLGAPFVGASGQLLREQLFRAAGLDISQWHILNVFQQRPPQNDLDAWTLTKTEAKKHGLDPARLGPPIRKRYLHPDYAWQVEETRARLSELRPAFILGLGGVAHWLLTGDASIGTYRGTIFSTPWGSALCTYHPAAILRQYSFLPIAWADLTKSRLYLEGALPAPLRRTFYVNPTLAELAFCYHRLKAMGETLGVDIETAPSAGMMTTISFSTPTFGICIPLWDKETGESYWKDAATEVQAWRWIERFAALPCGKVTQNGLYDTQYLLDSPLPIRLRGLRDDTAILQHSLQPELPKALGFLASIYLNEPSWKQMRSAAKDEVKADE